MFARLPLRANQEAQSLLDLAGDGVVDEGIVAPVLDAVVRNPSHHADDYRHFGLLFRRLVRSPIVCEPSPHRRAPGKVLPRKSLVDNMSSPAGSRIGFVKEPPLQELNVESSEVVR